MYRNPAKETQYVPSVISVFSVVPPETMPRRTIPFRIWDLGLWIGVSESVSSLVLGSTVTMVNDDGEKVADVFDYYPYGKQVLEETHANVPITETFTGKELDRLDDDLEIGDDGVGLYYFGARYYDSDVGIFLRPDDEKQFWSRYAYGGIDHNALNSIDHDGNIFIWYWQLMPLWWEVQLFMETQGPLIHSRALPFLIAANEFTFGISKGSSSVGKVPDTYAGKLGYMSRHYRKYMAFSAAIGTAAWERFHTASVNLDFTISLLIDWTVKRTYEMNNSILTQDDLVMSTDKIIVDPEILNRTTSVKVEGTDMENTGSFYDTGE